MARLRSIIAKAGMWAASIAALLGFVFVGGVGDWISDGSPHMPQLADRWWAGYVETAQAGKEWRMARFFETPNRDLKMVLFAPNASPETFDVQRNSSDREFVHYTLTEERSGAVIHAKQMYEGERYVLGRLMAGRIGDFWKENEDLRMMGDMSRGASHDFFGIEPISGQKLDHYWAAEFASTSQAASPAELLRASGIPAT